MNGSPLNRSVVQIVQKSQNNEVDASVMVAIANISNQIKALADRISQLQGTKSNNYDSYGNDLGFGGVRQTIASLINGAGVTLYKGDVLINGSVGVATVANVAGDESVIGVVNNDGRVELQSALNLAFISGVYLGSHVAVLERGKGQVRVKTDSTPIAIGDCLKAGSDARYAVRALPNEPGVFARALQAMSANMSGLIDADVNPKLGYYNTIDGQPWAFKAVYDTDGTVTGFSNFLLEEKYFADVAMSTYIRHDYYKYSADGSVVSMIMSNFNVGGSSGKYTLQQTIQYSADLLDEIIQEISG